MITMTTSDKGSENGREPVHDEGLDDLEKMSEDDRYVGEGERQAVRPLQVVG